MFIDNESALHQMKAWHQTGDKPLSEPMSTILVDIGSDNGLSDAHDFGLL